MAENRRPTDRLSRTAALALWGLAIVAFHGAYQWPAAAGLVVVYLACLFRLAWAPSARWAFYLGLAGGFAVAAPQLAFFVGLFGPAAFGLWAILGLWHALYLLLAWHAVARWPRWGVLWIPVLWLALEYARSELYYLRFSWLIPGFALHHPAYLPLAGAGVYGFSFLVLTALAVLTLTARRRAPAIAAALLFVLVPSGAATPRQSGSGPYVVGIQLEGAADSEILAALERAVAAHPDGDLFVLSEYSFDGPVPEAALEWCRTHRKHLIAGGKEPAPGGEDYFNTAFVVSPAGEIVLRQAKSVPVQFLRDGQPAPYQTVWHAPWGRIGLGLCYDLSYARVIDPLIVAGAEALIVPTSDLEQWGEHEHRLHAKIAPVRAREYGVPIFRLTSSGISQLVRADGRVVASGSFPGRGEIVAGVLPMRGAGTLPPDRYLAPLAVAAALGFVVWLGVQRVGQAFNRPEIPRAG